MTSPVTDYFSPLSLDFERDGTDDIAVIRDADGEDLVTSRPFWLPEGDDPIPPTLIAVRVMAAAPKLLEALHALLAETVERNLKHGIALTEGEAEARAMAWAAIAEATR